MKTPKNSIDKFSNNFRSLCLLLLCSSLTIGCGEEPGAGEDDWPSKKGLSQFNKTDENLVLRRKSVHDPARRNMVSHTIFVPDGWKMKGITKWPHANCFRMLPSPKITVTSPTGVQAAIHHTGLFSDPRPSNEYMRVNGMRRPQEMTSDGGSLVMHRPDTLRDWKEYFRDRVIPERHPNARNIRVTKVSEAAEVSQILQKRGQHLIAQVQRANMRARSLGMPELQSISISGLLIEATFDENGVKKEFVGLIGLHSMQTQMQGLLQVRWSMEPNISYTAPQGELESNLPALFAITGSMRPTKPWIGQVQQYIVATTPRNPSRPMKPTFNAGNAFSEILDISHNGYLNRSNMTSTGQSKYINSIHQTSNYSSGGTNYHLPAGFDHVYTDDNDTIILTNNSLFDPNVEVKSSANWTKMSEK